VSRLAAPTEDGGLLIHPPSAKLPAILDRNRAILNGNSVTLNGVPLCELRETPDVPRIASGHQPEFFHPGVWAKNFVLHAMARRVGGEPLFLIADHDTMKSTGFRWPVSEADPARVKLQSIPFDVPTPKLPYETPYEERGIVEPAQFAKSIEAIGKTQIPWTPLLVEHAARFRDVVSRCNTWSEATSCLRRSFEKSWGIVNRESSTSQLCTTPAFAHFVTEIATHAGRFAEVYNGAIREYRQTWKLKSLNHPAPELKQAAGPTGSRVELPFWVWHRDRPLRQGLWAKPDGTEIGLLADTTPVGTLRPAHAVDDLSAIADAGWKIRPRALSLTLFVRLCVADLFIHGIGGAKYDEVTDTLFRKFFGIEAPAIAVATGTLRLPLTRFPTLPADRLATARGIRDLTWNPQRYRNESDLSERKAMLIAQEPQGTPARRVWFRQLQAITAELRAGTESQRISLEETLARQAQELDANAILGGREYAWPLHAEASLRDFLERFLE
jgi:hypothetical protein